MTDAENARAHSFAVLSQLASAINEPVATFFGDPPQGKASELFTLVQLWLAIDGNEGRRRVLDLARTEAGRTS